MFSSRRRKSNFPVLFGNSLRLEYNVPIQNIDKKQRRLKRIRRDLVPRSERSRSFQEEKARFREEAEQQEDILDNDCWQQERSESEFLKVIEISSFF